VDLEDEEGGANPAKRPNSSLLEKAVYAMNALAGDPRLNAHYIELHKEDVTWRAASCFSAQEYSFAVCACFAFVNNSYTMIYALVTCALFQAPSSSRSLNRRPYKPKVSSTRLPKAPVCPLHFSLRFAPFV
jgi:hypothetical protein